jgi:hypothetical protein
MAKSSQQLFAAATQLAAQLDSAVHSMLSFENPNQQGPWDEQQRMAAAQGVCRLARCRLW